MKSRGIPNVVLVAALGMVVPPAFSADIELPPGRTYTVREGDPVDRFRLNNSTLNVLQGGETGRIQANNGAQLNMQGGRVSSSGENAITLSSSHATIDGSTIVASADPSRPDAGATGIHLSGANQSASARVSNSHVIGIARGINVATGASLDLVSSHVDGLASGAANQAFPGGSGLVLAGGTATVREGSVVSGDANGAMLFASPSLAGQQAARLTLDQSSLVGREGSAIWVFNRAGATEDVYIDIRNGSSLSGGNGVILEIDDGAVAHVEVEDSRLSGDVQVGEQATLNLSLTHNASLVGAIDNATSLSLDNTSSWTMERDSTVGHLALAGGTVDLRGTDGASSFNRLQLGELSGNGSFMLGTDLAAGTGDFLEVTGNASGEHQLLVQNSGVDPQKDAPDHQVVQTGQGSTSQFALIGGQVDFGTFAYELEQRGDDWFLVQKGDTTTPGTRSVTGLFSAAPTVWYGESTTLRGRMGELRNGSQQGGGWLRTYGNKYKVSAAGGAAYDQVQQGISFGADMPLPTTDGQWLVGLMGGYSRSNLDLAGGTTGKVDSFYVGAYSTWLADNGFYIDALIKANRFRNASDVRMSDGHKAKGSYDNNGLGASVEVGKHYRLEDGWFVEPFAQVSGLWVGGQSYTLDNGMRATGNQADSLLGKVGTHVGRTFPLRGKGFVQPYVKVAAAQEFARNNQVRVNGNRFDNDLSGSRIELGAGVAAQVTEVLQVQAGFDYMKGKNIEQPWGVSVGVRYNW